MNTRNKIPVQIKMECLAMKKRGMSRKQIYDEYFKHQFDNPQAFRAFEVSMKRWAKENYPDSLTLDKGTYEGFTAHGATVQVSGNGKIVQAWIKQSANDIDLSELVEVIKEHIEPYEYELKESPESKDMLEIPLFDMHWGIAYLDHYKSTLDEILNLITSRRWERIVIPFGQDFFHNDSVVKGETTKGTVIEKVDMQRAVKESMQFIYAIIDLAIDNADSVQVLYTPGNHDRSISWMFMQILLERYGPEIVDDSMEFRKCITYGRNAIMVTHGDSKRANPKNLAPIFSVSFPEQFANANVREIHAGHLHSESDTDIFGVMVRRLASGNKTDEWSDKEDFIGSHKRFMLFQWSLDKLKSIHYI